ncbi:MAG: N-6 DNA methylase [Planctomycetota bacterium]
MPAPSLRRETLDYIGRTPLAKRKAFGQFFTPEDLRRALLDQVRLPARPAILDPACGTGEFLRTAREVWPDAQLAGLEIDPELARIAAQVVPEALIRCEDALAAPFEPAYDLVLGNPPYFQFKPDAAFRMRYATAISGRPNTYACFVKLGLELLRPGGMLAFVLPPSMNNGAYFQSLREFILSTCRVESLRVQKSADRFVDANQAVMLLRIVKGEPDDGRFVFSRGPFRLLCQHPERLRTLFEGATTLDALGYSVRTGSVVWNQVRELLSQEPEEAVRLLWAHNVGKGALDLRGKTGKPGFVRGRKPLVGPAIVVNRVTGHGRKARIRAAVVPDRMEFLAENHVNVVLPPKEAAEKDVVRVAAALADPRSTEMVRELTGNTQISSLELLYLIPVHLGTGG